MKEIGLFAELSDEQLERLLAVVHRRSFPEGETIIREGDEGDRMYVLLDGTVEVSKALTMKVGRHEFEQMDKSFMRFEGKHRAVFGEISLLQHDVRTATVQAVSHCTVLEISTEAFDRYCESDPLAGYRIVRKLAGSLADRLRATNRDVIKLTTALSLALAR